MLEVNKKLICFFQAQIHIFNKNKFCVALRSNTWYIFRLAYIICFISYQLQFIGKPDLALPNLNAFTKLFRLNLGRFCLINSPIITILLREKYLYIKKILLMADTRWCNFFSTEVEKLLENFLNRNSIEKSYFFKFLHIFFVKRSN